MKIIDEVYPLIKCEARLSDDGTLWIKTDTKSAEQTKRVLIEYAENSFCKTFYQDCDEPPTIPTFAESAEAYKAWTGEEMGKTSDEINEMNKEIIKDILKMMPTAYLLEALGVSTFEELTEPADRPHGEWIPCSEKLPKEKAIVLTYDTMGDVVFGQYDKGKWYWEAEACADYWAKNDGVIAWMPLPTQYKGGDTK